MGAAGRRWPPLAAQIDATIEKAHTAFSMVARYRLRRALPRPVTGGGTARADKTAFAATLTSEMGKIAEAEFPASNMWFRSLQP